VVSACAEWRMLFFSRPIRRDNEQSCTHVQYSKTLRADRAAAVTRVITYQTMYSPHGTFRF